MADTDPINLDELIKPSGPAPEAINLDDLGGLPAPPAPPAKPYLSRAGDIPKDIRDMAVADVKDTAHSLTDPYLQLYHGVAGGKDSGPLKRAADVVHGLSGIANMPANLGSGLLGLAMSPIMGPVRSMVSRPVEENYGIPKEVTELAAGLAPTALGLGARGASRAIPALEAVADRVGLRRVVTPAERPLTEHLHDAADENFARASQLPIAFDDNSIANLGRRVLNHLRSPAGGSYDSEEMASTVRQLRQMMERPGAMVPGSGDMPTSEFSGILKRLGRAARETDAKGNRTEAASAASRALEMINNEVGNFTARDVAYGDAHLAEWLQEMHEGRGNWAGYLRTKLLGEEVQNALRQAGATGTGSNMENAIRQHFARLYKSSKSRMYNADEKALIDEVARGDTLRNALRYVGKYAPSSPISAAIGQFMSGMVGGIGGKLAKFGIPLVGAGAKKAAEERALAAAERVSATAARRTPYYESLPSTTAVRGYMLPIGASHPLVQKYLGNQEEDQQ